MRHMTVVGLMVAAVAGAACATEEPDELAQERCDKRLACEQIEQHERVDCVLDERERFEERQQEGADCWRATLDFHDCEMDLDCETFADRDGACSTESSLVMGHCRLPDL